MATIRETGPWNLGAREAAPYTFSSASPRRAGGFFRAGPANRLLSQANRAVLPAFPTVPTLLPAAALSDANYFPGARASAVEVDGTEEAALWVSSKRPWLRRNRLLWRPRTVVVTGAGAAPSSGAVAAAVDTAWDAIDAGGWEVVLLRRGLFTTSAAGYHWGLPVTAAEHQAAPAGDFTGAFGELVLGHLAATTAGLQPYRVLTEGAVGAIGSDPPHPPAAPRLGYDAIHSYTQTVDTNDPVNGIYVWQNVTLYYHAAQLAGGPPFFAQVRQHYDRFRLVVAHGSILAGPHGYDPSHPYSDADADYTAELMLTPAQAVAAYTGLPAADRTVLTVPYDPANPFAWEPLAGQALAGWLAANLNA